MHILSYRTLENMVEDAVIIFVDVTMVKKARQTLRTRPLREEALAKGASTEPDRGS
jgi:hypothetical protein